MDQTPIEPQPRRWRRGSTWCHPDREPGGYHTAGTGCAAGVDRIACEDTRQTQKLLNHFGISKPTESCHEHNERERTAGLIAALRAGGRIAVVTDAGMPGISDPGSWLAAAAIEAGIPVFPIPGANAALSALVASGLPTSEFHFLGFLPEKAGRGARASRF